MLYETCCISHHYRSTFSFLVTQRRDIKVVNFPLSPLKRRFCNSVMIVVLRCGTKFLPCPFSLPPCSVTLRLHRPLRRCEWVTCGEWQHKRCVMEWNISPDHHIRMKSVWRGGSYFLLSTNFGDDETRVFAAANIPLASCGSPPRFRSRFSTAPAHAVAANEKHCEERTTEPLRQGCARATDLQLQTRSDES